MNDIWFSVIGTTIVTVITVLIDWLAARHIIAARYIAATKRCQTIVQVRNELAQFEALKASTIAWGADLATVAFSMDLAGLMIWISEPQLFPFFQRFDSDSVSRGIPVWFLLLGIHSVLLVLSIIFMNLHMARRGSLALEAVRRFSTLEWVKERTWILAGSAAGITALLLGFMVFLNAGATAP